MNMHLMIDCDLLVISDAFLPGQDCIGCAKTGSGKTAAFALPILQKLSEDPYGIFCLVITPTRFANKCTVESVSINFHYMFFFL